jgi:hypothetical protein
VQSFTQACPQQFPPVSMIPGSALSWPEPSATRSVQLNVARDTRPGVKPSRRKWALLSLLGLLIFLCFYWWPTSLDEAEAISDACRTYICDAAEVQRAQANRIEGYAIDGRFDAVLTRLSDLRVPVLPATRLRSERTPPQDWGSGAIYFDTVSGKRIEPLEARASFIGPVAKVHVESAGGGLDSLLIKFPFVGWHTVRETHFRVVY